MNLLAPFTFHGLLVRLMENPFRMGVVGTGSGSATMFLATLAEKTSAWDVFDKFIFRLGATAAALSSILMVILMVYRVVKARKESIASKQTDKHD